MRSFVYVIVGLLLVPLQANFAAPLGRFALAPDLGIAVLSVIGLLTGPLEAAFAGVALGLLQDVGSASLLGLSGLTMGVVGLLAGLLGQRMLDIRSSSNIIFFGLFSLAASLLAVLLLNLIYGGIPVLGPFFFAMLPRAVVTAATAYFLLRFATRRTVLARIRRHKLQGEI
jgi:rod shape-determining protein MreD